MKKSLKLLIIGLIIALIAGFIYKTFFNQKGKIDYLTETVRVTDIKQTVNATGEVSAVQLVNVGAQVSGQILKLHMQLGDQVKKGDLLAEIDSVTQINDLNTNKARLNTYNAQLASAKIAQTVAQSQYTREVNLFAKNATSKEKVENANNTLASAKAKVAEIESVIKQTQISVSTSETNLGYTRILAPLSGTIVSAPVEEGQTVNSNQATPTIVQIADLRQMQIKMQISEGDVTKIKRGMKVTYSILSEPNAVFETTLNSVDPGLTTLSDGTYKGTSDGNSAVYYYGNLVVPNEDGKLHIGMTTQNVIIIAQAEQVLAIPKMVIREREGKKFVNVLENGDKVVRREIEVGLSDTMNTQVLSGLTAGEKVVSAQMGSGEMNAQPRRQGMRM